MRVAARGVFVAGLVLCSLVDKPARAQLVFDPSSQALNAAVIGIGSLLCAPPLVATSVYVGRRVRPPLVWPILGFVLGAGAVALGAAFTFPNSSSMDSDASVSVVGGTVLMLQGAATIALSIAALTLQPDDSPPSGEGTVRGGAWIVAPYVARGASGHLDVGAMWSLNAF